MRALQNLPLPTFYSKNVCFYAHVAPLFLASETWNVCAYPYNSAAASQNIARYNKPMASSIASSPVVVRCKGILFDMDGILISSLGSVERSWTKWAQMRDVDPAYALTMIHGRRAIESIAVLRPDLDSREELKLIEDIELADGEGIQVLPGVLDLIAALPRDRWTVVTSATSGLARMRLAASGFVLPERLVTADTVNEGKPHPAPFLAGAALLGLAPQECVVFEDSASGVKAGHAAGCTVIATTFSHPAGDLENADYLVPDLTAIKADVLPEGSENSVSSQGHTIALRFTPLNR